MELLRFYRVRKQILYTLNFSYYRVRKQYSCTLMFRAIFKPFEKFCGLVLVSKSSFHSASVDKFSQSKQTTFLTNSLVLHCCFDSEQSFHSASADIYSQSKHNTLRIFSIQNQVLKLLGSNTGIQSVQIMLTHPVREGVLQGCENARVLKTLKRLSSPRDLQIGFA